MARQDPTQLIIYAGLGYAFYHFGKKGTLGVGVANFLNSLTPPVGGGGGGGGATTPATKDCPFIEGDRYIAVLPDGTWEVVVGGVRRYIGDDLEICGEYYRFLACGGPKPAHLG